MVSGAWNAVKTHVLWMLLGQGTLTIWKFILNELPPLSPPIFTHTSSEGIAPSCHVSLLRLQNTSKYHNTILLSLKDDYYSLFLSSIWKIFALRSGIKAKGAALISSPPDLSENVNGTPSAWRLSVITSFERFLNLRSLAIFTFHSVSHLHVIHECIVQCFPKKKMWLYLRIILSLFQGIARSAFIANPCSGGMSMVIPALFNSCCLSSWLSAFTSASNWTVLVSLLMVVRILCSSLLLLWSVLALASPDGTRGDGTCTSVSGYSKCNCIM